MECFRTSDAAPLLLKMSSQEEGGRTNERVQSGCRVVPTYALLFSGLRNPAVWGLFSRLPGALVGSPSKKICKNTYVLYM